MKIVKLKDISINNRGYYGIGASAVEYDVDKYTYLRITDINDDGSLNKNDLMSIDDKKANQYLLQNRRKKLTIYRQVEGYTRITKYFGGVYGKQSKAHTHCAAFRPSRGRPYDRTSAARAECSRAGTGAADGGERTDLGHHSIIRHSHPSFRPHQGHGGLSGRAQQRPQNFHRKHGNFGQDARRSCRTGARRAHDLGRSHEGRRVGIA